MNDIFQSEVQFKNNELHEFDSKAIIVYSFNITTFKFYSKILDNLRF